jgi:hypothetical protein
MDEPAPLANEGWFNNRWRPAIAWQYFIVCFCDFVVFPVFTTVYYTPNQYHEWHPLTLQGGGLYHLAMGGIIGVTSWRRSDEKVAMYNALTPTGTTTTERTTEKTSSSSIPVDAQSDAAKSSRAD